MATYQEEDNGLLGQSEYCKVYWGTECNFPLNEKAIK